jgi:hypothetical protein
METAAGPPVHVQEETFDPNRGQRVKSATGMFRGVGGAAEVEALNRAKANYDYATVESSNVAAGAFDFVENILFIEFKSGHWYYYPASSPGEWMSFLQASSKGRWVLEVLRGGMGTDGKPRDLRLYGIMPG